MSFLDILTVILPPPSFLLFLSPSSILIGVKTFLSPFPWSCHLCLSFLSLFNPYFAHTARRCNFFFTFLQSLQKNVLLSKDSELGAYYGREHGTFFFLCLGYLSQYDLFSSIHLPAKCIISFFINNWIAFRIYIYITIWYLLFFSYCKYSSNEYSGMRVNRVESKDIFGISKWVI